MGVITITIMATIIIKVMMIVIIVLVRGRMTTKIMY